MGNGYFDYIGFRINDNLSTIGGDVDVRIRFPRMSRIFLELGDFLEKMHDELDKDLSGSRGIKNDVEFEDKFMEKIREIVGDDADLEEIENIIEGVKKRLEKIEEHQNKILNLKR